MKTYLSRRTFVERLGLGALVGVAAGPTAVSPQLSRSEKRAELEPWLAGLNGLHKQFFDVGALEGGKALRRVDSFLDAYTSAYLLEASQLSALFGAHSEGLLYVCGDALWARYELGKLYDVGDPLTGKPAIRNIFLSSAGCAPALGIQDDATVDGLMGRGVRFLACNNSIVSLAKKIVRHHGSGDEGDVAATLGAGLVSRVMRVPAMTVACNRAQETGFTYSFLT